MAIPKSILRLAVKVCEALSGADGGRPWTETTVLLRKLDLPHNARPTTLKLLHKLEHAGVLHVLGKGKFQWRLASNNWNRENPFNVDGIPADDLLNLLPPTPALDPDVVKEVFGEEATKPKPKIKMPGVVLPNYAQQVFELADARRNILLVGPAGCGKTHLASLTAKYKSLRFGSLSCTSGMSESHLLGKSTPNVSNGRSRFHTTEFLTLYEGGGIFLMDELDAADANLLLCINSAIANDYCNVPNRFRNPRAERHKDFVMIATANTFGRGANRTYAGRNQLDEATLDRYRIGTVECWYDEQIERTVCPNDIIRNRLQVLRNRTTDLGIRRIISTRFMSDAYIMHKSAGWSIAKITEVLFQGWTEEEKRQVAA